MLGNIDPRLPFWVAAGFSFLNFGYGLFVLPESLSLERRERFSWQRANPLGSLKLLRSHRELFGLAIVNFVGSIAHEALPTIFVLYAMYRYGWNERTVGLAIAAVGLCSALVGAGLVEPVVARFGERRTMLAGLLFGTAGFVIYGVAYTGAIFWAGLPLGGLVGTFGAADAGHDDAARRCVGAGTASGRAQQSARHRVYDRPARFHQRLRELHRRESRLAFAGCAVSAGGVDDRRFDGDGLANDALAHHPAGKCGARCRCHRRINNSN